MENFAELFFIIGPPYTIPMSAGKVSVGLLLKSSSTFLKKIKSVRYIAKHKNGDVKTVECSLPQQSFCHSFEFEDWKNWTIKAEAIFASQHKKVACLESDYFAVEEKPVPYKMVPRYKDLILFIHGFGGSWKSTFKKFPDFMSTDTDFADYFIDGHEYPSGVFKNKIRPDKKLPDIPTLMRGLDTAINETIFAKHPKVSILAHSLGGVISAHYILDKIKDLNAQRLRIDKLILYAVPTVGAHLAKIAGEIWMWPVFRSNRLLRMTANAISNNMQIKGLTPASELLNTLQKKWSEEEIATKLDVHYVMADQDDVVNDGKVAAKAWKIPDHKIHTMTNKDHLSLVKPTHYNNNDDCDPVYLLTKNILLQR